MDIDWDRRNKHLAILLWHQVLCLANVCQDRTRRRHWVRPLLQKRLTHGEGHCLVADMVRLNDAATFLESFRMSRTVFDELLALIGPAIQKQITRMRAPIPAKERLLVTLRYLATGDDQRTIATSYRLGTSTVNTIIRSTCVALWDVLMPLHMPIPTQTTWEEISTQFWERWDFPNCVGAIDGKHVRIRAPFASGAEFHNYKGFFSVVMMVLADAQYRITVLEVGESGHNSDGGIFARSSLGIALRNGTLKIPPPTRLPGVLSPNGLGVLQNRPVLPHVIVGDEAFPLQTHLMRPYPRRHLDATKRIFNYRLSRSRRIAENVFGILAARWRFYLRMMFVKPETIQMMVKASCVLHNFLRNNEALQPSETRSYCPRNFVDHVVNGRLQEGEWRTQLNTATAGGPFQNCIDGTFGGHNHTNTAADVRASFARFFMTEDGEVPWQYDHV